MPQKDPSNPIIRAATRLSRRAASWARHCWLNLPPSAKDPLVLGLLGLLGLLAWIHPTGGRIAHHAIHLPTLEVLMGLMILTQGINHSHFLDFAGQQLIQRARSERSLARWLILFTLLLAGLLTNDIALFIVVPLTLSLRQWNIAGWRNLIILEALAANVGAALSPIGSPQNIYLWQTSHVSMAHFIHLMALWVLLLGLRLLGLTETLFSKNELSHHEALPPIVINQRLFWSSLLLYLPFLYAVETGHPILALALTLPLALLHRPLISGIDWGILGIFILFFLDVGWLGTLFNSHQLFGLTSHPSPRVWILWGAALSQIMSNVPATLYLGHGSYDMPALSLGVNAGAYGLVIGSMANLIALRLARDRQIWRDFHRISFPFLAYALVTALLLG
ncbi:MAG: SLC13 family permease [Betaproteobacteria bacterium]|nr:SLC13 family permease [Betaproteobacteria bacterium]